ncbi:MAG: hypothetical protein WDO56_11800 [Gammaproteobacteria bacterium]
MSDPPCITNFRSRIRELLREPVRQDARSALVILAVDGIPATLARRSWPRARLETMRSVQPTTSSSAWLSALSGMPVSNHGVPGVVFRDQSGTLINVFADAGTLAIPSAGTIFTDARDCGYTPVVVMGDLESLNCSWRRALLEGAEILSGFQFYSSPQPPEAAEVVAAVRTAIHAALSRTPDRPCLVWCFVDADLHIHKHGYDDALLKLLQLLEQEALALARSGVRVVAHSDHGLVLTTHSADVEAVLKHARTHLDCEVGGAGRTRWLYAPPGGAEQVADYLRSALPSSIRICEASELFAADSLAGQRIGQILLIAQADEFVTMPGYCYDHGSDTAEELFVPYAFWDPALVPRL